MADVLQFYLFAGLAIAASVLVIGQRNPMYSIMLLIVSFGALAGLYIGLDAPFVAMAQIVVYAGAIMVLFIFVIMLLNAGTEQKVKRKLWVRWAGVPLFVAFLGLAALLAQSKIPGSEGVTFGGFTGGTARDIGRSLFTTYLLPFEVTSLLILIAIIGAIVLARKEID